MKIRNIVILLFVSITAFIAIRTAFNPSDPKEILEEFKKNPLKAFGDLTTQLKEFIKKRKNLLVELKKPSTDEKWVLPNPKLRYDQSSFLTSHNSHASFGEGFKVYYQQYWNLSNQLKNGVRGFMIDNWPYENDVYLCHGGCDPVRAFQRSLKEGWDALRNKHVNFRSFKSSIELFSNWLKNNPKEIVTLILEDHYPDRAKVSEIIDSVPEAKKLVLRRSDWNPYKHNGQWPTLQWMQDNNKRLLVFDDQKNAEKYDNLFYVWAYAYENNPGETFDNHNCVERGESKEEHDKKRTLYILNYFGHIASNHPEKDNTYDNLKKLINSCAANKVANKKNPNFLALDYVNVGQPMKLINEMNQEAEKLIAQQ